MNAVTQAIMMMNGDIVIGYLVMVPTQENQDYIMMDTPAVLVHRRNDNGPLGFMLYPWSPNELLGSTTVSIMKDKIQAHLVPSPALTKFYEQWVIAEKDKMASFVGLFEKQIEDVGKHYLDRQKFIKEQQQKSPLSANTTLTNAVIELFDDLENEWGDPTVSH